MMQRPKLLVFLAGVGILLGTFGAMYSVSSAAPLLQPRDQFMTAFKEVGENQIRAPELRQMVEQEAEATYARRGTFLPLYGINVLLSLLLLSGCTRALRGSTWGISAWEFASLLS